MSRWKVECEGYGTVASDCTTHVVVDAESAGAAIVEAKFPPTVRNLRASPYREGLHVCPTCRGTGRGAGCMEQGGFTHGLCPDCHGYGKWMREAK
jgi:hypothetical protein